MTQRCEQPLMHGIAETRHDPQPWSAAIVDLFPDGKHRQVHRSAPRHAQSTELTGGGTKTK